MHGKLTCSLITVTVPNSTVYPVVKVGRPISRSANNKYTVCLFGYNYGEGKTNTLSLERALTPDEEMERRETVVRLSNASADQLVPI